MKIRAYLINSIKNFFAICSCMLIGTTIFLSIFPRSTVNTSLLWQIIFISAAATLFDIVYYDKGELSKKSLIIRNVIHFMLINLLLFTSAYYFDWFKFNNLTIGLSFEALIIFVYILVFVVLYINDSVQAKKFNKRLNEYRNRRSEGIE